MRGPGIFFGAQLAWRFGKGWTTGPYSNIGSGFWEGALSDPVPGLRVVLSKKGGGNLQGWKRFGGCAVGTCVEGVTLEPLVWKSGLLP